MGAWAVMRRAKWVRGCVEQADIAFQGGGVAERALRRVLPRVTCFFSSYHHNSFSHDFLYGEDDGF